MPRYTYVQWLKIAQLIEEGNMVWCRNGEVCPNATPCSDLSCNFKPAPSEVLEGIRKCKRFQITEGSNRDWNTARHIDIE